MYDNNNIFARILRKEIPCNKVFENEQVLAFYDISPARKTHILIIPKGKYTSFDDFCVQAPKETISTFFQTVQMIAKKADLSQNGYRLISNHGSDGGQEVPHFHVHILGGEPVGNLVKE